MQASPFLIKKDCPFVEDYQLKGQPIVLRLFSVFIIIVKREIISF